MTTKLTLTMDNAVIASAKKYASQTGKSVSDIVENYLMSLTAKKHKEEPIDPRIAKLKGSIRLPEDYDYKKVLGKAIRKKHNR